MAEERRYWAFLSYSHADVRWTAWLHRQIEGYRLPSKLVGRPSPLGPIPRHLRPVFRDREELSAAADLGDRLRAGLRGARFLIVICSRRSARSQWVEEEIRQYKAYHGEDRVLAVIVDGEPYASNRPDTGDDECFPRALRFRLRPDGTVGDTATEPIAADLRPVGDGKRLALLKLISGMVGVNLDELVRRDARRRQVQLTAIAVATSIMSAVFATMAVVAVRARDEAIVQRAEAIAQRTQAEGLVEFMIGDLRKKLAPSGRLDALDAVGERALNYYQVQATHGMDASALGRRSRVLHMLGEIQDRRGHLAGALAQFQQASSSTSELLRRAPNDPDRIFEHAQSVYWVGYAAYRQGQDEPARRAFATYVALAERLHALNPAKEEGQAEVDYANSSLGSVLLENGHVDQAAAAFRRALDFSARLARAAPRDRDRQIDLAQSYAWVADVDYLSGRLGPALALRDQEAAVYLRFLAMDPTDTSARNALALNRNARGRIYLGEGRIAPAIASLREARQMAQALVKDSPEDATHRRARIIVALNLSQASLQAGLPREALAEALVAEQLSQALVREDPLIRDWGREIGGSARVLVARSRASMATDARSRVESLRPIALEAAQLVELARARPRKLTIVRLATEASLLAGDYQALRGDRAAARNWWEQGGSILKSAGLKNLPAYERTTVLRREIDARLRRGVGSEAGGFYRW